MPLTLNGVPMKLKPEEIKQYKKKHIFTILPSDIRINDNKETKDRVEMPRGKHVPCTYNRFDEKSGAKVEFRYYINKLAPMTKDEEPTYEPFYVMIRNGVLESEDYELNICLANSPFNQTVVNDPEHPCYNPQCSPYFKTYIEEDAATKSEELNNAHDFVVEKLSGEDKMSETALRAFAKTLNKSKQFSLIPNIEDTSDRMLRIKIRSLLDFFPQKVYDLLIGNSQLIMEELEKMQNEGLIKYDESTNSWCEMEPVTGNSKPFIGVLAGEDRIARLAGWWESQMNTSLVIKTLRKRLKELQLV